MKRFSVFVLICVSGCAPRFDIVDKAGSAMFEIRKGTCFIGCDVNVRRSDGVKCSGFAGYMEEGRILNAQIKCPDDPHPRLLSTAALQRDEPVEGVLGPPKSLNQRNREAIDAARENVTHKDKKD